MATERISVRGKFLSLANKTFYLKGVTYGTFRSEVEGYDGRSLKKVKADFKQIASNGFNAIRTYTTPPVAVLDAALEHGLKVMIGLPWEQHITFLRDRHFARSIEARVKAAVSECAGHPALLCYAVGNEIPSPIVRWHGRWGVERFLRCLYNAVKQQDPDGLVTYVNYPSTEYLQLPFLDLVCFNVYLESQSNFEAYLARLQNIAGDRPLIMGEIGIDSRRNGEAVQARTLDWQIRTTMTAGCAGAFVFSWTDEWYRGGSDIDDWDFGLTTRQREPKLSLAAARNAFHDTPFSTRTKWPRISVVVCSYNGSRTIQDCLAALQKLNYPDYEVIIVNDGSTDDTQAIASQYPFRLINTENRGLSHARNTGLAAATGEIVAYIDDDAYPDEHWLHYIAISLHNSDHAGVGGPNLPPPNDGMIAQCVANAPGGPIHVLLSDRIAEHIPGCNMAFKKSCLEAIGGFDGQFRVAGDDVDVCWRLQEKGWTLGFSPSAVVWHHRRNCVRAYWRQQRGYGKAEALLERKWPEKYNVVGHIRWAGQLYGRGLTFSLGRKSRIYQGRWGSAPFQTLQQSTPGLLGLLPTMPEWYLIIVTLACLGALSPVWPKLIFALPLLGLALAATFIQACLSVSEATFRHAAVLSPNALFKMRALTGFLHVLQPMARLAGRLRHGLTAWRNRAVFGWAIPRPREIMLWTEKWRAPDEYLKQITASLRNEGITVFHGGDYDQWDLEVRTGTFGTTRLWMVTEEHGDGKQLRRFKSWPYCERIAVRMMLVLVLTSIAAFVDNVDLAGILFLGIAGIIAMRALQQCSSSTAAVVQQLKALQVVQVQRSEPAPVARPEVPPNPGLKSRESADVNFPLERVPEENCTT